MLTFAQLRNALYDWVAAQVAPAVVIWANQNNPKPNAPYAVLQITPARMVGQDYVSDPSTSGSSAIVGNREFTLLVQHIGVGGYAAMETLRTSLEEPTVYHALHAAGLVGITVADFVDISVLSDNRYEDRYSMDVRMRVDSQVADAGIGLIEHVQIPFTTKHGSVTAITGEISVNAIPIIAGEISHWLLDNNAVDVISGHNGTVPANVVPTPNRLGTPDSAYLFDGDNADWSAGRINVPFHTDFNADDATWCFWCRDDAPLDGLNRMALGIHDQNESKNGFALYTGTDGKLAVQISPA